jgi:hypothetical protein
MKNILWLILIFLLNLPAPAQERLKPGKLYDQGADIYAPGYGIKSRVPPGWTGVVPMDTEVFLLMPLNNMDGQIYVMADSTSYEVMKANWMVGLELGNGNILLSEGRIFSRGDAIASNVILSDRTTDFKGYIEARCGPYGVCVSVLLLGSPQNFEALKQGVIDMSDHTEFVEPSDQGFYDDFDWNEFLAGKYLASYEFKPGAKSENELWLCPDGSFRSKLKRTGLLKEDAKAFQGKQTGTWETPSVGPNGKLILHFSKQGDITLDLLIDDDRIFLNERKYFVMISDQCK